jgi:hypothetical protein
MEITSNGVHCGLIIVAVVASIANDAAVVACNTSPFFAHLSNGQILMGSRDMITWIFLIGC